MKLIKSTLALLTLLSSFSSFAESGASTHSILAGKHSALASAHSTVATSKVASAVVSVPLTFLGNASIATGSALKNTSEKLSTFGAGFDEPLEITDKVITADAPPNQVIIKRSVITKTTVQTND